MERLQGMLKEKGLSNYRVARDLHMRESTVRSWLKGRSVPRVNHLDALAAYLGVHPAWLLYGDKTYAPTAHDKALLLAEKIIKYGPAAEQFIEDILPSLEKATAQGGLFRNPGDVGDNDEGQEAQGHQRGTVPAPGAKKKRKHRAA